MFTATRRIEIDAAHRVPDHGSKCRSVHGHRYVIEATIAGDSLAPHGEQGGMIMDFGFMKEIMVREIYTRADHGMILYSGDVLLQQLPQVRMSEDPGMYHWAGGKLWIVDQIPTAENLAMIFYQMIAPSFRIAIGAAGARGDLKNLRVYETPNCWADYGE